MKRILALTLAALMLFAFAACGNSPEDKVAKYVEENGDELIAAFDEGFSGSGMTYETEIKAEGTTIVLNVKITDFGTELPINDETLEIFKPVLQTGLNEMKPELKDEFDAWKEELPELENFVFNMCDKDGNVLASLETNE